MSVNKYLQNFLRKQAKAVLLATRLNKRIKMLTSLYMKRLKVKGILRKQLKMEAMHHMEQVEEAIEFLNHLRRVGVSDDTKEKDEEEES